MIWYGQGIHIQGYEPTKPNHASKFWLVKYRMVNNSILQYEDMPSDVDIRNYIQTMILQRLQVSSILEQFTFLNLKYLIVNTRQNLC